MTILLFVVILSILVILHELGHFIVAKKAGIGVEEFGLGLPPRIYGKKIGETIYSLNILPFGGFVKLVGEDPTDERKDWPNSFYTKKLGWRLAVVTAGVAINFLVGVVLFYLVLGFSGFKMELPLLVDHTFRFVEQKKEVVIVNIEKGSAAERAGLTSGDIVVSINNTQINDIEQFQELVKSSEGRKITINVRQANTNNLREIEAEPYVDDSNRPVLGVYLGEVVLLAYNNLPQRIFSGLSHSLDLIGYSGKIVFGLIKFSVSSRTIEPLSKNVTGPIGIANLMGEVVNVGIVATLQFIALLSLNLAVLNILPFPPLDGGRLLFVTVELVTRKRLYPEFEKLVHTIGFIFLVILIVLVTYNDILRIVSD